MKENNIIASEEEEPDYIGNIWGWKFSFISLALIIIMSSLIYLKQLYIEEPSIQEEPIELKQDSIN